MSKIAKVMYCLILLLFVSGCTSASEAGAKRWVKASAEMDWPTMSKLTCAEYQNSIQTLGVVSSLTTYIAPEIINELTGTELGKLLQEYKIDVSDIDYEQVSISNDQAVVHAEGSISASILHMPITIPVDSDYYMIKESGKWKWCGGVDNVDYESLFNNTLNNYEDIFNNLFNITP